MRFQFDMEICHSLRILLLQHGHAIYQRARLEQTAATSGTGVTFLGRRSDDEIRELYRHAAVTLLPGEEDFGIVPVEAMVQGAPVIALGQGGILETVVDGKTGVIFHEPTVESLIQAIKQFGKLTISPKACIAQAKKFSKERFKKELKYFVETKYTF